MRAAALFNVHGNIDALDAVLEEVRREQVDSIIVGGDVLPGPMPRETMTRLLELDIPVRFIHGNGERVIAAQMVGGDISEVPEGFRDVIRWTAQQLDPQHQRRWRTGHRRATSRSVDSAKSSSVTPLRATIPSALRA